MSNAITAGAVVYAKDIARTSRFYAEVAGLEIVHRVDDHVVLESAGYELVVVAIPPAVAAGIVIASPPARRENTAFRLVFFVPGLAEARRAAEATGGTIDAADKEWTFQGERTCNGIDPEGNVIQLREAVVDPDV